MDGADGPATDSVTGGGSTARSLTGSPSDDRCDAPSPARPRRVPDETAAARPSPPRALRAVAASRNQVVRNQVVQSALSPVHGAEGDDAASARGARGTHPAAPGGRGAAKVAIVGAGRVGTTLAYTCLVRGVGKSSALYGRDPERLRAEV